MTTTAIARRWQGALFTAIPVSMAAVVFAGFSRSFFLRPWFPEAATFAAPEPIFYVHGALNALWMALLIVQSVLIRTGRVRLHRRLGVFGVALAASIVVVGSLGALVGARRPGGFIGLPIPPLQFLGVIWPDMILFGLFVGLAVALRRHSEAHKRLMLLATVNLLEAAIIRIPFDFIADGAPLMGRWLSDGFIVLLAAYDLVSRGRLHPATLWGGLAIVASQPLRWMFARSELWLDFAGWAVWLLD